MSVHSLGFAKMPISFAQNDMSFASLAACNEFLNRASDNRTESHPVDPSNPVI